MGRIAGTPPFFIQAMEEDGRRYIAGFTMNGDRASLLLEKLMGAISRYRGYVKIEGETDEDTREKAAHTLYTYDRWFKGSTVTYDVVSITCYDKWPEFGENP